MSSSIGIIVFVGFQKDDNFELYYYIEGYSKRSPKLN